MTTADVIPFSRPFPEEILVVVARGLARDGQSATLAALLSTSREYYALLLPMLYRTLFLTDRASIFIRDLIDSAYRLDASLRFGLQEVTVTSITFGLERNALYTPYPPVYRTSPLDRAKFVRTLILDKSGVDAAYRRCKLSWFVPPDHLSPWPCLLPSLQHIIFPAGIMRSIAERYEGLPIVPSNNADPVIRWFEWHAPFQAVCEGLRLISPLSAKVCIHVAHHVADVDHQRADTVRDGQIQEALMVLDILRGSDGVRAVVYEASFPSSPLTAATAMHDLLAIIKFGIQAKGPAIRVVVRNQGSGAPRPLPEEDHAQIENFDLDDPPALPTAEAEALWRNARARMSASTVGVPPQHQWRREQVDWERFHDFLRRDLELVNATQRGFKDTCTSCGSSW